MRHEKQVDAMKEPEDRAQDPDRRAALRAIAKYSAAAGGAASFTVLSAEDAVAKQPCSKFGNNLPPGQDCATSGTASRQPRVFNGDGTETVIPSDE